MKRRGVPREEMDEFQLGLAKWEDDDDKKEEEQGKDEEEEDVKEIHGWVAELLPTNDTSYENSSYSSSEPTEEHGFVFLVQGRRIRFHCEQYHFKSPLTLKILLAGITRALKLGVEPLGIRWLDLYSGLNIVDWEYEFRDLYIKIDVARRLRETPTWGEREGGGTSSHSRAIEIEISLIFESDPTTSYSERELLWNESGPAPTQPFNIMLAVTGPKARREVATSLDSLDLSEMCSFEKTIDPVRVAFTFEGKNLEVTEQVSPQPIGFFQEFLDAARSALGPHSKPVGFDWHGCESWW